MNKDDHRYDDMLCLPHHVSPRRSRMSDWDRAAQFSPFAALTGYGDSAISYTLRFWVENADYWTVTFYVNQNIKKLFDENGVEMTYPHLNVHLDK